MLNFGHIRVEPEIIYGCIFIVWLPTLKNIYMKKKTSFNVNLLVYSVPGMLAFQFQPWIFPGLQFHPTQTFSGLKKNLTEIEHRIIGALSS